MKWAGGALTTHYVSVPLLSLLLLSCDLTALVPTGQATPIPEPPEQSASTATPESVEQAVDKWALWAGGTQLRGANIYQRRVYLELDGTTFMGDGPGATASKGSD